MNEQLGQVAVIMKAVQVAYRILAARVLALLALLMTFGLFSWAMAMATWLHFAIAGAFGITIFLPVLVKAQAEKGDGNG